MLLFISFDRVDCFELPRTPSFATVLVEFELEFLRYFGGIFF